MNHTLTELQYSSDRNGPFKLYIYEADGIHHRGGVWFEKYPKYPEEGEITIYAAALLVGNALNNGRQIRICDGGDHLVYHAIDGHVIYGDGFFSEIRGEER